MKKKILSLILTFSMLSSFCVFAPNANAAEKTVAEDDFESFTNGLTHEDLVSSAYDGTYREDGWGTAWTNTSNRTKPMAEGGVEFSIEDDGSGRGNNVLKVKRNVFRSTKDYSNGNYQNGYYDETNQEWVGTNTQPDSDAKIKRKLDENFTNGTLTTSFKLKLGGGTQEVTIGFGGLSTSTGKDSNGKDIPGKDSIGIRKNQVRSSITQASNDRKNFSNSKEIQPNEWYDVSITLDRTVASNFMVTVAVTGTFGSTTSTETITFDSNSGGSTITACDISYIYFKSDRTLDLADVGSLGTTNTSSIWYIDEIEVIKDEPLNPAGKINWSLISNNQPETEVIDKLNLVNNITVDGDDYEITWATSDEDAVDIDGNVYPGNETKTATLTAYDTEGNSKEFEITVPSTSEIDKYLVRANFDKYALGDAKNAIIWTHKYSDANGCYTNYNVVPDAGSRALHIERTVFGTGTPYKDKTNTQITEPIATAPDVNERYMPAMKENITEDEKVQIDTRVKFLENTSTFGIRFDGVSLTKGSKLVEIQTDEMINCMGGTTEENAGYQRVSFPSKFDANEYIDLSMVVDFPNKKVELTAKGKSNGTLKTQTITGNLSQVKMETLDISSIGLISRRDTSASTGVYIDYFRVKNITDSALNDITWDDISNGQDIANVTDDLYLDETVTWTSSNETVITPSGVVSRPQYSDAAVKVTAKLDSGASKSFDVIVRATEPAIVSVNFDDYDVENGTVVDGLGDEWTETYPSGSMKGVKYTVAQDPTNADNQVMKAERYIMYRNDQWVNGYTDEAVTGDLQDSGPEADDIAKITFDEPVTQGNVTLSTRVMFADGTEQSIGLNLYGLYDDADKNVVIMNRDEFGFSGDKVSYGGFKAIPNVWYNVFFKIDFDSSAYTLKIGDLTFSDTVDNMEELSAIGIYSDSAYDTVETGTSVWYVDDVVVREGLSNAEAVSLAKENLDLPETVTADITLPTTGLEETTITWVTTDETIINKDGEIVVTHNDEDETVKLIATIKKGAVSETKEFTITVPAATYDVEHITPDANGLQISETPVDGKYIVSLNVEYKLINAAKTVKLIVVKTDANGDIKEIHETPVKTIPTGTSEEPFEVWFDERPPKEELEYYLWTEDNVSLVDNEPSKVSNLKSESKATYIELSWAPAKDDSNVPVLYDIYDEDGKKIKTTEDAFYRIEGKADREHPLHKYSVKARDKRQNKGAEVLIEASPLQMYFANADGTNYGIAYKETTDTEQDAYTVIYTDTDGTKAYTQQEKVDALRYIYFYRTDCDITPGDKELVFEIDYKERGGDFYFVYNSYNLNYDPDKTNGGEDNNDMGVARKNVPPSEIIDIGGGWKTAVIRVTDAQLRESFASSGASFGMRIYNTPSGKAILVKEVRVIQAEDYDDN